MTTKKNTKAAANYPQLGDEVRDIVSGFAGVVMGRTEYITGCTQIGVAPRKLNKDGTVKDWAWFDDRRLTVVKRGAVALAAGEDGGPQPTPPARY